MTMKICVTATGEAPDSPLDPRFGRCGYFIFFDTETGRFETLANQYRESAGGAGIRAGQEIGSRGAEVLLTGKVGPNALEVLNAAGVRIVPTGSGTVRGAVNAFLRDETGRAD